MFGTGVTFLTAKSYGIGGPNISNVMREIKDLTGTGSQAGPAMYKECAILINFELPRSLILRRRRVGRKWLHVVNSPDLAAIGGSTVTGETALSTTTRNFYLTNYAQVLVDEAWPGGAEFASGGDPFTNPTVGDYLEHRQFHR